MHLISFPDGQAGALQVRKEYYGRGLGKTVAKHLLRQIAELGYMNVITILEENKYSRNIFEPMGFQLVGRVRRVYTLPNKKWTRISANSSVDWIIMCEEKWLHKLISVNTLHISSQVILSSAMNHGHSLWEIKKKKQTKQATAPIIVLSDNRKRCWHYLINVWAETWLM